MLHLRPEIGRGGGRRNGTAQGRAGVGGVHGSTRDSDRSQCGGGGARWRPVRWWPRGQRRRSGSVATYSPPPPWASVEAADPRCMRRRRWVTAASTRPGSGVDEAGVLTAGGRPWRRDAEVGAAAALVGRGLGGREEQRGWGAESAVGSAAPSGGNRELMGRAASGCRDAQAPGGGLREVHQRPSPAAGKSGRRSGGAVVQLGRHKGGGPAWSPQRERRPGLRGEAGAKADCNDSGPGMTSGHLAAWTRSVWIRARLAMWTDHRFWPVQGGGSAGSDLREGRLQRCLGGLCGGWCIGACVVCGGGMQWLLQGLFYQGTWR